VLALGVGRLPCHFEGGLRPPSFMMSLGVENLCCLLALALGVDCLPCHFEGGLWPPSFIICLGVGDLCCLLVLARGVGCLPCRFEGNGPWELNKESEADNSNKLYYIMYFS